jgi:hypothetical protein
LQPPFGFATAIVGKLATRATRRRAEVSPVGASFRSAQIFVAENRSEANPIPKLFRNFLPENKLQLSPQKWSHSVAISPTLSKNPA